MKLAQVKIATPVRIVRNTTNPKRHQWAKIVENSTGKTLHTGQVKYIRRVARKKFNLDLA